MALKVAPGSDAADRAQTCIIRWVPEHPRERWAAVGCAYRTSSPEARP